MVLIYIGEVGNGGHTQFFSNRGGTMVPNVESALAGIGLDDLSSLLRGAVALFPNDFRSLDRDGVDVLLDGYDETHLARLDEFDRRIWKTKGVFERLIEHLRRNESHVLRPERGL